MTKFSNMQEFGQKLSENISGKENQLLLKFLREHGIKGSTPQAIRAEGYVLEVNVLPDQTREVVLAKIQERMRYEIDVTQEVELKQSKAAGKILTKEDSK